MTGNPIWKDVAMIMIAISFGATCASCAEIKPERRPSLEITTDLGFSACKAEYHDDCVRVRLRNTGSQAAAIGLDTYSGGLLVAAPNHFQFEGERSDGQWVPQNTSLGTFEVPTEFLTIAPGREGLLTVVTSDFRNRKIYLRYRLRLTVNSTEEIASGPLDLDP